MKILILLLVALFLVGCQAPSPDQTLPSTSAPAAGTAPTLRIEADYCYSVNTIEEFLRDLALVKNGEYPHSDNFLLEVQGSEPCVYIPECHNPEYALRSVCATSATSAKSTTFKYYFFRVQEDGTLSDDDLFLIAMNRDKDNPYEPFPEGTEVIECTLPHSWYFDLGDRWAMIQFTYDPMIEDPAELAEMLSFTKYTIGQAEE